MLLCDERAKELGESIRRTSVSTGIAANTLRSLTLELTNADFVLDDVVGGMQALSIKGVKTEQDMRNLLPVFDTFSDVLGISAYDAVAKVGGALETFGLTIYDAAQKQDVFSYVLTNSTEGIDEFLNSFERLGVEIRESGISLEQYAQLYVLLEKQGLRGRAATKALREAINEAGNDFGKLCSILGVTEGQLNQESKSLSEAAGLTEKLDKAVEESISSYDKMKASFDKLRFSIGSFLEPLSFLGPVLSGIGPVMMSLSVASQAWGAINFGVVVPSLTAVTIAGAPLWLVLGAIAAAVLALIVIWKNWGKITDWIKRQLDRIKKGFENFCEALGKAKKWIADKLSGIKSAFASLKDSVSESLSSVKETLSEKLGGLGDKIKEFTIRASENIGGWEGIIKISLLGPFGPLKIAWDANWLGLRDTVKDAVGSMASLARSGMSIAATAIKEKFNGVVTYLKSLPEKFYSAIKSAMQRIVDAIKDKMGDVKRTLTSVVDEINPLNWDIPGLSPFLDAFEHAGSLATRSLLSGLQDPELTINPRVNFATSGKAPVNASEPVNVTVNMNVGSVRSQQDIDQIEKQLKRVLERQLAKRRGT
ncbi:MAG: phage tail tape measure protein [Theionarchaea archaeon]|nr:phage tail tape measure protein [Theionarchaea archaeon]